MAEKKEVLSLEEIKKELQKKKEPKEFLKDLVADDDYKDIKKELQKELAIIISKKPAISYNIVYDSLSEGLEPIYFWVLDFMRESAPGGLKLDVWKGPEEFEASVSSGYFGEIGQRASLMQQKAMEYLGAVNNVIKSVLNLIYDLKEFEIRLGPYNKLNSKEESEESKRSALHSLKGIWMDQVDARKGRGSINLLVQDLQFVTLRDAFFYVKDGEEMEKKKLDLNERVKNILKRKLEEFNEWQIYSEKEIRKRYEVEKSYLKSQAATLKLYVNWLKPYLIAAQKLQMKSAQAKSLTNPNIVNSFSNIEIELKLYGKREIQPSAVHKSFEGLELDRKYYALIEVAMNFRSVPSAVSGQGGRHYVHGGRTEITINAFGVDSLELEAVESRELYEDLELIDSYIGTTLTQIHEDIEKFTKDQPKEEKKETKQRKKIKMPFGSVIKGFREIYSPIKETFGIKKKKGPSFIYKDLEDTTKKQAESTAFILYNVYKKTHGMIAT